MTEPLIHTAKKPRELIHHAVAWLEQGHRIAMLTLVVIEGNAPYPVGSQMLVRDDGQSHGQITGGCAETALIEQALTVINSGQNTTERYGLGSRFFDIKLPCGSGLDIEFDVTRDLAFYQDIQTQLNVRQAVTINQSKRYYPTPRILLFGQGPIVDSMISLATQTGFDVLRFDHTQNQQVHHYCDQYTALVSLFHEHDFEIDILHAVIDSNLAYIGALGSKRTHAARLQRLSEKGVEQVLLNKIHGPIGLNIDAITPSQIAVSILAQIIGVMNSHAD